MKYACFSVAAMDYFSQQKLYRPGGNSLNQAIHLSKMGCDTSFLGAVGDDIAGNHIINQLEQAGVDITHTQQMHGSTASNIIVNDANGERFGVEGAWKNGVYGDYRLGTAEWDALGQHDAWLTTCLDPHFEQVLLQKPASVRLCVDFLHLPSHDLLETALKSGALNLAFVGGTRDMTDTFSSLSLEYPHIPIILTLGAEGSIAYLGGKTTVQAAIPVDKVFDTTGCGDSFQAAFTDTYFQTSDIKKSLFAGAKLAQKTTQHYGAQPE